MEKEKQKKEITLGYLFGVLKKSLIVLLIAMIVSGAAGFLYAKLVSKPSYEATSGFWINNTTAGSDYTSTAQTTAASDVADNCVELAKMDKPVRRAVRNHNLTEVLGIENENDCVKAIIKMIDAHKEEKSSGIFYVTVTAADPEIAHAVMTAIEKEFPDVIKELYGFKHDTDRGEFVCVVNEIGDVENVKTVTQSAVKLAIVCALAAMVVVYVIYLVLSLLDNSVTGETVIKENFEQPILGNVPTWYTKDEIDSGAKRRSGERDNDKNTYSEKLLGADTTFYITEAFNSLRTNVIYANAANKNPVLVVTGDNAGVGKSIVSSNLALSIANLKKRVLLVGCDMRCPSLFKIFGTKAENGLSELLAGIVEKPEDVIYKYGDTGLDVIFSGKIPPNPSELLSAYRMKELVDEWKKTYDYIILDMPPLVNITDAAVVSSLVNGYILTVRCNSSNVRDIQTASERIKSANGTVLGFVVNDVNPKSTSGYGGKYGKYSKYGK